MKPAYILPFLCVLGFLPLSAQNAGQNYIQTRVMLDESGSRSIETIQYYDGLGRPSQTVQKNATPSGSHLVGLQEYDAFGREANSWLPVVSNTDYLPANDFKTQAATYYGSDERPYSFNEYENSPLNRPLRAFGPGTAWDNHPVSTDYLINTASGELSCRNYAVGESGSLVDKGNCAGGSLYVVKSTDEDNRISYTFTDVLDRQRLVRQMSDGECHDTYFVYDDFGNQCFVLPPAYTGPADLPLYAYQYKYDGRNRCIEKKLPGCDPVYYVYDKTDRMVFSQDGVQRGRREWMFYLYDAFGRLTVQGVCKNGDLSSVSESIITCTLEKNGHAIATTGLANSGYSSNYELVTPVVHMINFYDNYDFLSISEFKNREYYPEGTVNATGYLTGKMVFQLAHINNKFCSAIYYDTKGRVVRTTENNNLDGYETTLTEYTFTGKPLRITQQHIAGFFPLRTEIYNYVYDDYERVTKVTHQLDNYPVVVLCENLYDELGRLQSKWFHGNDALQVQYTYNIRDWLTLIAGNKFRQELHYTDLGTPQYNGNLCSMIWKSGDEDFSRQYRFVYDKLNRLTNANYGENNGRKGLYATAYTYDKMGNMTGLKRYGLSAKPSTFGLIDDLRIEHTGNRLKRITDGSSGNDPLYNGAFNFVDGTDKEQEYEYDANGCLVKDLNKGITQIDYNALNLPDKIALSDERYIDYHYSADGALRRKESYSIEDPVIEEIYKPFPKPEPGVKDSLFRPFPGGFGRLTSLSTNGINSAPPHSLEPQMPPGIGYDEAVSIFKKGYVSTYYCGNVLYESGKLKKIFTGEGYITIDNNTPTYHYYLKDHLGNNRIVADQSGNIEEVNHYYPFGGLFGESTSQVNQPYKFGDKELDRMHGLDWYNFEARFHDPAIPSMPTPDPLSHKYYSMSPYVYCMNNPINNIDPTGMFSTRFGAWFYKMFHGGDILQDKGGEYFVSEQSGYIGEDGAGVQASRRFDWDGRSQGRDLNSETIRSEFSDYLNRQEFYSSLETAGAEIHYTANSRESALSFLNLGLMTVAPSLLKGNVGVASGSATTIDTGGKIATKAGINWTYGAFKSEVKWANQMARRGWTEAQITEAITKGKTFNAVNNVNKANGATRYVHPTTGKSVVIDNITKELLQVGGEGFLW